MLGAIWRLKVVRIRRLWFTYICWRWRIWRWIVLRIIIERFMIRLWIHCGVILNRNDRLLLLFNNFFLILFVWFLFLWNFFWQLWNFACCAASLLLFSFSDFLIRHRILLFLFRVNGLRSSCLNWFHMFLFIFFYWFDFWGDCAASCLLCSRWFLPGWNAITFCRNTFFMSTWLMMSVTVSSTASFLYLLFEDFILLINFFFPFYKEI